MSFMIEHSSVLILKQLLSEINNETGSIKRGLIKKEESEDSTLLQFSKCKEGAMVHNHCIWYDTCYCTTKVDKSDVIT